MYIYSQGISHFTLYRVSWQQMAFSWEKYGEKGGGRRQGVRGKDRAESRVLKSPGPLLRLTVALWNTMAELLDRPLLLLARPLLLPLLLLARPLLCLPAPEFSQVLGDQQTYDFPTILDAALQVRIKLVLLKGPSSHTFCPFDFHKPHLRFPQRKLEKVNLFSRFFAKLELL
jgi:hypothetical protein